MFRVRLSNHITARKLVSFAATALAVSALSGCGYFQNRHHITVGSIPDDYRTNHPIILNEREETLDVPVGSSDTKISFAQQSGIEAFISQYTANGSGLVQILLPTGSTNASAAQRVHSSVIAAIRNAGVSSGNIVTATYDAQGVESSAPVRLSYRAMSAATEPCGKWPDNLGDTTQNKNYENFGCASQNNMASMIANPADLLGPRKTGRIDPAKRSVAIKKYQTSTGSWTANTSYTW